MAATATTIKTQVESIWTTNVTASPPLEESDDIGNTQEILSEVDEWLTKASHWLGFTLRFDSLLDAENVKTGLEKMLYHFPALGARVVVPPEDNKKLYRLAILSAPHHQGVVLEYCKGSVLSEDSTLPDETCSRQVWKQAGLDAPGPEYSGEASLADPLMRAKLIVFEEQKVSYLCVGINHGICDGSGICDVLQVWSHFCTTDKKGIPLPESLSRRRVLGERVYQPVKPAKNSEELFDRMQTEIGIPYNPFKLSTLVMRMVPRAVWCTSRQHELELRICASKLEKIKEDLTTNHFEKGEWVSKFELLCACLLLARRLTSTDVEPPTHNLHVACNLRGRAKRFPKDYFGNAAFDFCEPMTHLPTSDCWTMDALALTAKEVHTAVRHGLADAEANACKAKDWYEAARHLGLKNMYDIWAPVVFDALHGTGTFVNSWDKRWLDCPFDEGTMKSASCMVAWFGTLQNLLVEVPRHSASGDSTIYLALPPSHAERFRSFWQGMKDDLPFEIV